MYKEWEKTYYTPRLMEELAKVTSITTGDKIITFNSRYSILTIQKKNRFTLLKKNSQYFLGINDTREVQDIFFFNIENNKRYPIEKQGDLYIFEPEKLPSGNNIMIYQNREGLYTTVRKQEMTNQALDDTFLNEVIVNGRIEIEVE